MAHSVVYYLHVLNSCSFKHSAGLIWYWRNSLSDDWDFIGMRPWHHSEDWLLLITAECVRYDLIELCLWETVMLGSGSRHSEHYIFIIFCRLLSVVLLFKRLTFVLLVVTHLTNKTCCDATQRVSCGTEKDHHWGCCVDGRNPAHTVDMLWKGMCIKADRFSFEVMLCFYHIFDSRGDDGDREIRGKCSKHCWAESSRCCNYMVCLTPGSSYAASTTEQNILLK